MKAHERETGRVELIFSLVAGLTIIGHFIASFFPSGRTWGFHHLLFFPLWVRIVLTLAALLVCVPRINKPLSFLFQAIATVLFRRKRREKYLVLLVSSILSFTIFWFLRTKTHFLGDGYLRIRGLAEGDVFSTVEPLDTYVHFLAHAFFNSFRRVDPATTYAILSCLSGALFVSILLILSASWTRRQLQATFVCLSVITMGLMQLFFGYVENYTLMTTGILLYMTTSLLYLNGKCSIFYPSLSLSLTICFHTAAFPLIGSLAYLVLARQKTRQEKSVLHTVVNSIAGFCLPLIGLGALALYLGYGPEIFLNETGRNIFLPLSRQTARFSYSLLSASHLIDFVNEHVLISPAAIITILILTLALRKRINFRDTTLRFFTIATACVLIFTFVLNPKLGLSRDWDLFSLPGIPYTLLGLHLAISRIKDSQRLISIGTMCVAVNLLHTAPWILVNADENRSIDRFTLMIQTQTVLTPHYAYEELGTYFRGKDQPESAVEFYEKAIEASPDNWRLHTLLGGTLSSLGRYDEAIRILEVAKELSPEESLIYWHLGTAYMDNGMYDLAIRELTSATALDPNDPDKHEDLGRAFFQKGMFTEALDHYQRAADLDPDNSVRATRLDLLKSTAHYNLGTLYGRQGLLDEAIVELKKALALNPFDAQAYENLGVALMENRLYSDAETQFKKAITLQPKKADLHFKLGYSYWTQGRKQEAISEWEKTLAIDPNHDGAKTWLSEASEDE